MRRDLTGSQGQFYSAEDADSDVPGRAGEHAEGAFYLWAHDEIEAILGQPAAAIFNDRYGVARHGNVRDDPQGEFPGKNVLMLLHRGLRLQTTHCRTGAAACRTGTDRQRLIQ